MKTLSIGSSLLEITCAIPGVIQENQTIRLDNKIECGGGHAGNVAYLLGKWGVESYIASMMGADDTANKIKKEYEAIGVRTDFIETSYDKPTSQSIVIVNTTNKNKTIIIADGNDLNATIAAFDRYPKAVSYLMVTRSNNEVLELCKYVGNIIFNKEMAEIFAQAKIDFNNSGTIVNVYNILKQKFSKAEIVITLGERGCVYSLNGQVKIMPPVVVQIEDTNGAGDVFAGAYIYGMGRNFGLEKSIAYANIAASLSTTKMTSRMSIPALTEVSNYYDSKFGPQNNPNNMNQMNNQNMPNNVNVNGMPQNGAVNNNVNS